MFNKVNLLLSVLGLVFMMGVFTIIGNSTAERIAVLVGGIILFLAGILFGKYLYLGHPVTLQFLDRNKVYVGEKVSLENCGKFSVFINKVNGEDRRIANLGFPLKNGEKFIVQNKNTVIKVSDPITSNINSVKKEES